MNQKMNISIRLLLCMIFFTAFTGCHSFRDHQDEKMISIRNRYRAHKAWKHVKKNCNNIKQPKDFGRGFKEGYRDVCMGGNGCPPALPPRRYRSIKHQNLKQRRWFDGYEHGALAAEQAGITDMNYIATSNRVMHNQPIPGNQQYEESIPPQAEQNSLPELAPGAENSKTNYASETNAPPLLPLTSPAPQDIPQKTNKTTTLIEHKNRDDLADFQPFEDDVPDLDASEDLNIGPLKEYVYEDSKASLFEIRPASTIQQASFEQEQTPQNSGHHQKIQMQIRPKTAPKHFQKNDDDDEWLMPEK
jgi:hypothetical protein